MYFFIYTLKLVDINYDLHKKRTITIQKELTDFQIALSHTNSFSCGFWFVPELTQRGHSEKSETTV